MLIGPGLTVSPCLMNPLNCFLKKVEEMFVFCIYFFLFLPDVLHKSNLLNYIEHFKNKLNYVKTVLLVQIHVC